MSREENVSVFQDTLRLCNENDRLKKATQEAISRQKAILEGVVLPEMNYVRYQEDAQIIVSKKRTYEAAESYKGQKVAVLNFASASNPGGGVVNGANAQEECLCRCSNLYSCLNTSDMWAQFYTPHRNAHDPIHNDDIIYTPAITVFKTDTAQPKFMDEEDWYQVDVITCAAPNLRTKPSNGYNTGDGEQAVLMKDKDLQVLHEKRLRRILDVAVLEGAQTVILGAFGCGAFRNSPEVVAQAAKNVVADYRKAFDTIEFAVYCSPRDERNYDVFKRVLGAF